MSVTNGVTFVQAAHVSAGSNLPVNRIVIHGTVSPCVPGGAMSVAQYFTSTTSGGSAQYVVDPTRIVQCVAEAAIAWHAPPNPHSLGIELCDPQTGLASRWSDANHESMLRLAAAATAELAAKYGVPLVKLSAADLLAGKRGICGHVDVSQAWHQSDHTDPGSDFPWSRFMSYVTGAAPTPAPQPAPVQPQEMFTVSQYDDLVKLITGYGARIENTERVVSAITGQELGYGKRIEHIEQMVAQLLAKP